MNSNLQKYAKLNVKLKKLFGVVSLVLSDMNIFIYFGFEDVLGVVP